MASGDTLLVFTMQQNEPPSSNAATFDTRNQHLLLDFDDSSDEVAVFRGILPKNYSGGGIDIFLHFAMSSATSGNAVWETSIERLDEGGQDIDSDGFASGNNDFVGVPGTSGQLEYILISHTDGAQMDSLAVGESFRLKVSRLGSNVSDTATGDAELLAIEIREI